MKRLFVCLCVCLSVIGLQAQKTTKISAVADGYNGKVIDFEFVDNPDNNMQFPYVSGNRMEFEVELKEPALVKVNMWMWLLVCPGDEIHADIHYNGKNYRTAEFRGTPSAVALNEAVRDGRNHRVAGRYKTNPLAAVVTRVPVNEYYAATQANWKKEQELLEAVRSQVEPFAYEYLYAELEGMYLSNLVRYPYVVADVEKKNIDDCLPEGYWNVLDGYRVRDSKAALKSFSYAGWLLDYKEYADKLEAHRNGQAWRYERDLQKSYDDLVAFYDGDVLDTALYVWFYNALTSQQGDFDLITKLSKDYFKKYNKNKKYRKELTEMQK